ncbi:hypothetical protein [Streptomyces sparsogenes]|uniref:Uncharacterized protein n=1 Tax=Streptomyces sparsogenes DSM 40356 TaxID=1331668 RepID=A0A1R1S8B6_9ACTN|nr:hypothetical protein [Streptomyces sparsogenes]OMI34473.1 hypothetical protein SPAR_36856 [Streptomyces sparsogenes DSM 40356]
MSTFFQNPEPDTIFEQITSGLRRVSPFTAMFDAAEDTLLVDRPEGFTPEDIGRLAYESLPEAERDEAMDQLFYTYWSARENDREEMARYEREQQTRTELADLLDVLEARRVLGIEPSPELNADIARLARTLLGGAR